MAAAAAGRYAASLMNIQQHPRERGRPAAAAAFYNLFIPLSLQRSDATEGKINFTLYLNVKSFGFDRISFQIVLINLLLRLSERAAGDIRRDVLQNHAASYRVLFCCDRRACSW